MQVTFSSSFIKIYIKYDKIIIIFKQFKKYFIDLT
jgi:hypothetical protein